MKKTIKGWCKQYDINWYGQGSFGPVRYDWKLVLSQGKSAIFSSMVESNIPESLKTTGRSILVFPNVNSKKNNGKISEERFLEIIHWVNEALHTNKANEDNAKQDNESERKYEIR